MWRTGNPCVLLVGIYICAVTMINGMEVPQRIKIRTTARSTILSVYQKKMNIKLERYMHFCVHCSTIYNSQGVSQGMNTTYVSVNRWMKKMWYIYNGMLFSHKKEGNLAICDKGIALTGIMLREISYSKRHVSYDLIWVSKKLSSQTQRTDW